MSPPRLTFLYPRFIHPFLLAEASTSCVPSSTPASRAGLKRKSTRRGPTSCRRTHVTSTRWLLAPGPAQRYGTATEPLTLPVSVSSSSRNSAGENLTVLAAGVLSENTSRETVAGGKTRAERIVIPSQESQQGAEATGAPMPPEDASARSPKAVSPTIFETTSVGEVPGSSTDAEADPLEAVLRMPPPSTRPVHLVTPRYVHFFDTWSLVEQLAASGFTSEQAVSLMKAVRAGLNDNVELARAGLVGKSDVENETYLFRAACSELRAEVSNNRKAENERMSTQRNQLQHEVDILGQRLSQDAAHLKEEIKGMFDDRSMAVRMEQKTMQSKIQELNYKITVALNSDVRSEVEGLRWIITRRAVTALVVIAAAILATLRLSSYMTHTQAQERKSSPKPASAARRREEDDAQAHNGTASSPSASIALARGRVAAWSESPTVKALGEEGAGDGVMVTEGGVSLG